MRVPVDLTAQAPLLVIGLGNPLLGDDGVGWHVAQAVERALTAPGDLTPQPPLRLERGSRARHDGDAVAVDYLAVGGLTLMERLAGCRSAVLIDAVTTGQQPPGSLYCLSLDDLPVLSAGHLHSAHDTSLAVALRAGAALGVPLPQRLVIVGIEASRVYDFDESLSEPVAACVPLAAQTVLDLLQQLDQEEGDL